MEARFRAVFAIRQFMYNITCDQAPASKKWSPTPHGMTSSSLMIMSFKARGNLLHLVQKSQILVFLSLVEKQCLVFNFVAIGYW